MVYFLKDGFVGIEDFPEKYGTLKPENLWNLPNTTEFF